jgi:hypothetical protein
VSAPFIATGHPIGGADNRMRNNVFSLNSRNMDQERRGGMDRLHLTQQEEGELLMILERYLPDLKQEIANTDRKEFRRELKERETFMAELIERLKH